MNDISNATKGLTILDCTLRDGGYYNKWDFPVELVGSIWLQCNLRVDVVELGFRFLSNEGFKGPYAFTTDYFLNTLDIPESLSVSVMINSSDLCTELGCNGALEALFPNPLLTPQLMLSV